MSLSASSSSSQSSKDGKTAQSNSATVSSTTLSDFMTSSTTATDYSSSPETSTASSVGPELVPPLQHTVPDHNHPFLLPVLLSLGIPLIIATMLFLYRKHFPDHYAKTERYCPIRGPIRFIKNLPSILAIRQRRERNRDITERQKRYVTRRSRSRLWTRVPSTVGPPRTARSERDTEQDPDEWLRNDMLEYYGDKSVAPSSATRSLDPATVANSDNDRSSSTRRSGTESSRSTGDKQLEASPVNRQVLRHSITFSAPRTSTTGSRSSMPPMRPWSGITSPVFSHFQGAQTHKTGQLTGDGPDGAPTETEATRRMREMVKAQREKMLRDEAVEGTFGLGTTRRNDEQG